MRLRVLLGLLFLFLFAFFVFRSSVTQDPDFGWHLRFGRQISNGTIPLIDQYSYTMPSYHFVDHEWGMDIFLATVYDLFVIAPLLLIFALVGICSLLIVSKETDVRWLAVPLFLAGGTLFEFVGVRVQIISWLFLAVLATLLFHKKVWQRFCFFVPALFLVWANLHGGFAIGIVVLGIMLFGRMIEQRKFDKKDAVIFVVSLLATLCNPYGYHLWTEVVKSATDPALRTTIQEWYPAIFFTNIAFWIYTALSVFFIIRYRRKFSPSTLALYGFLFFSGIASMRNIPVFIIVSFYPTAQGIAYLYEEAGKHIHGKGRFLHGYIIFSLVCLFLFLPQLGAFTYGIVSLHEGEDSYPAGAVTYLHHHLPRGQIFSSYDWGGYLVWQLPEKKVFIDGRMPSWRNQTAPKNESAYAFGEYRDILQNKESFKKASKKYDIDTVLVSASDLKEQNMKIFGFSVEKSAFLRYFFHSTTSFAPVVAQINKMGWREVYHDKIAVVFEKINK